MDNLSCLERRSRAATDSDALMGLVLEGALALAEAELGPALTERLRAEAEVPKKLMSFLRYPAPCFLRLANGLARELFRRGVPFEAGLQRVGAASVSTFFDSPVGKTMIALSGGEPHRMLFAAPVAYSTLFKFGERRYERLDATRGALHFQGDLLGPVLNTGVVDRGLMASAQVSAELEAVNLSADGRDFTLRIGWGAAGVH